MRKETQNSFTTEDVLTLFSNLLNVQNNNDTIKVGEFLNDFVMDKVNELIRNKFNIWEGKNGYFYTYVPDSTKKNNRRLIKKRTEQDLFEYLKTECLHLNDNMTLEDVFQQSIIHAETEKELRLSTITEYNKIWKQYLCDYKDIRIKDIDFKQIKKMFTHFTRNGKLSPSKFRKICDTLINIFDYATFNDFTTFNIRDALKEIQRYGIHIEKAKPRDDSDLVFSKEELNALIKYCYEHLDNRNMAILLMLGSGIRPGECVALHKDVVDKNGILTICRSEMRYEDPITKKTTYVIQEATKTSTSFRNATVINTFVPILENLINNCNEDGWLFYDEKNKQTLLTTKNLTDRLKYICEKKLNIQPKSCNKLRKTYATLLSECGLSEIDIINQMGHTSFKTTKEHYIKNRLPAMDLKRRIDNLVDNENF